MEITVLNMDGPEASRASNFYFSIDLMGRTPVVSLLVVVALSANLLHLTTAAFWDDIPSVSSASEQVDLDERPVLAPPGQVSMTSTLSNQPSNYQAVIPIWPTDFTAVTNESPIQTSGVSSTASGNGIGRHNPGGARQIRHSWRSPNRSIVNRQDSLPEVSEIGSSSVSVTRRDRDLLPSVQPSQTPVNDTPEPLPLGSISPSRCTTQDSRPPLYSLVCTLQENSGLAEEQVGAKLPIERSCKHFESLTDHYVCVLPMCDYNAEGKGYQELEYDLVSTVADVLTGKYSAQKHLTITCISEHIEKFKVTGYNYKKQMQSECRDHSINDDSISLVLSCLHGATLAQYALALFSYLLPTPAYLCETVMNKIGIDSNGKLIAKDGRPVIPTWEELDQARQDLSVLMHLAESPSTIVVHFAIVQQYLRLVGSPWMSDYPEIDMPHLETFMEGFQKLKTLGIHIGCSYDPNTKESNEECDVFMALFNAFDKLEKLKKEHGAALELLKANQGSTLPNVSLHEDKVVTEFGLNNGIANGDMDQNERIKECAVCFSTVVYDSSAEATNELNSDESSEAKADVDPDEAFIQLEHMAPLCDTCKDYRMACKQCVSSSCKQFSLGMVSCPVCKQLPTDWAKKLFRLPFKKKAVVSISDNSYCVSCQSIQIGFEQEGFFCVRDPFTAPFRDVLSPELEVTIPLVSRASKWSFGGSLRAYLSCNISGQLVLLEGLLETCRSFNLELFLPKNIMACTPTNNLT